MPELSIADLEEQSRTAREGMPRWFSVMRNVGELYQERFGAAVPRSLFHYTSAAALAPIVTRNELWLSDATFLNDRVEIEHGRIIACAEIEAAIAGAASEEVRAMLSAAFGLFTARRDPVVYTVCFSLEADDLAQWRGYGRGAGPVTIEFAFDGLMFGYTSEGLFHRVLYEDADKSWIFGTIIAHHAEAYGQDIENPRRIERNTPLSVEEQRKICAVSLYHRLWGYIVACKDKAFASEREIRFTYTAHDYSYDGKEGWSPEHPAPFFREQGGVIIPYLTSQNLDFQNMKRERDVPTLPIRSVRIGPCADPALAERGIRRLLDATGHADAAVLASTSPYRPR